eukprot:PhF_6_TR21899/c0_g1_i4/m.31101/K10419/DYNLRB, DNCL2; dynein light chain roadblock-type
MSISKPKLTDMLERLKHLRGVKGVVLCTLDGTVLEHQLNDELRTPDDPTLDRAAQKIVNIATPIFPTLQTSVHALDPSDDVYFVRIRTRRYDFMIFPEGGEFALIALQDPKPA